MIAPDSFGGTLTAHEAATAIAAGWTQARPDDEVVLVPMSDGGEGLLGVLSGVVPGTLREREVAGPHGKPVRARWLLGDDGTAYIESAEAIGLEAIPESQRNPLRTTTYGLGQLMEAARLAGVNRVVVGLGGSATVDGGAGALTGLGLRLQRENGHGLKVGGGELHHLRGIDRGWLDPGWDAIEVVAWADVRTSLLDAAAIFAPQKGADRDDVELLRHGLSRFADTCETSLGTDPGLRSAPWTGAAGGLSYGLAAALGARIVDGAAAVAHEVGLVAALDEADLVVTGEGTVDGTSLEGKVIGRVVELAQPRHVAVRAVVGRMREGVELDLEEASPIGPGPDPATDVRQAAARLAARFT